MSDVLRQIDEDLRKDRLIKLWKKYGFYLIVSMVLGLSLITGIPVSYTHLRAPRDRQKCRMPSSA